VFTNHYDGYFTNNGGDTGGIHLQVATPSIPATIVGKTITAVSNGNGKSTKIKLATTTFTKTPANNSSSGASSGNYTFARLSPICGIATFVFTSAADVGQTAYVQLSFNSPNSGFYFVMIFDGAGNLLDTDTGNFLM
jgi:hypothetical protein